MKRLFSLFLLISVCLLGFSQKIEFDSTNENGYRLIGTTPENISGMTDRIKAKISLGDIVSPTGEDEYQINVILVSGSPISAPMGARMLIKDKDGSVITLTDNQDIKPEDMLGKKRMIPELQNMIVTEYTISLVFPVSVSEIDQISKGVTKIRIELDGGDNLDKEWKKDKVGKVIAQEYSLIKKAVATNHRNSFTDDF